MLTSENVWKFEFSDVSKHERKMNLSVVHFVKCTDALWFLWFYSYFALECNTMLLFKYICKYFTSFTIKNAKLLQKAKFYSNHLHCLSIWRVEEAWQRTSKQLAHVCNFCLQVKFGFFSHDLARELIRNRWYDLPYAINYITVQYWAL